MENTLLIGLMLGAFIATVTVFIVWAISSELEIRKVKRKHEIRKEILEMEQERLLRKYKRK